MESGFFFLIPNYPMRIIFFGTPEFAASQLKAIIAAGYDVVAVVTMPDKPAGRGKKLQFSEVKKTALEHQLPLLQPEKLKEPIFLHELEAFHADLFVVVAFRMLPSAVWKMPPLGTFNLHASLLPQYRGAAPINHAIINGETETGLTTFFLNEEIDKGEVIMRESVAIRPDETAGELHDELMLLGNRLVVETIRKIETHDIQPVTQEILAAGAVLKDAPKIFKDFCYIRWNQNCTDIYNHIRGLSPYPAAHTVLRSEQGDLIELKVYASQIEHTIPSVPTGTVITDAKTFMKVAANDGYIFLTIIQQAGKKAMKIDDFLRGIRIEGALNANF